MASDPRPRATIHSVFSIDEDVVTGETRFATPRARYLHRWWSSRPEASRPMTGFLLEEHPFIACHVFVVERVPNRGWRFGHYGEQTKRLLDSDPCGRWVAEYSIDRYGLPLEEYYDAVLKLARCVKCFGMLSILGRKDVLFESLDCPMADDAGTPRFILGVMDAVAWEGSTL